MTKIPACVQLYVDAGKKCINDNECLGVCLIASDLVKIGTEINGFCSKSSDVCGCSEQIKFGIAQPVLCVD